MPRSSGLRRLWVPVALLAFTFVFASRFSEVATALHKLRHVNPSLLSLGIAPLAFVLLSQACVLRESLACVGAPIRLSAALRISLAMEFMQIALPSAGASGAGYLATQRGATSGGVGLQESVGASVVYYLSGYLALLIVVVVSGVMGLSGVTGVDSVLLAIGAGLTGAGILYIGPALVVRFRSHLVSCSARAIRAASLVAGRLGLARVCRRLDSATPKASRFFDGAAEVAGVAASNRNRSLVGLVFALGVDVGSLALLWLMSRSVGAILSPRALLVSYSVGTTLAIFSVTPSGVGIMEPAMLVSMTKYGVHVGTAAAAIALYRLVGFWLPFLLGLVSVMAQRRKTM